MKKIVIIVIILLTLLVSALGYFYYLFHQPCSAPIKPDNISKQAIWAGGCDGGDWIELTSQKNNQLFINIFLENGEQHYKGWFVTGDHCKELSFTIKSIQKRLMYFDGESILLNHIEDNRYCSLRKL